MSFRINGTREVIINDVPTTQKIEYRPWKTPETVTAEILASAQPAETYKAWVMSNSPDVLEKTYATDDPLGEREPVSTMVINVGKVQCQMLDEWLENATSLGYTVNYAGLV